MKRLIPEVEKEINAEVKKRCGDDEACSGVAGDQVVRDFMKAGKLPKVDWTAIIEHIDHAVKIAGIDHVGLGSDFDGAVMPLGMEDVTHSRKSPTRSSKRATPKPTSAKSWAKTPCAF